jgi:hypothetical protein
MAQDNGGGSVDRISNVGKHAMTLLAENQAEIASLCARLCQLCPVGASYLFVIDIAGKPHLVTADGAPIGQQSELIQIIRPATFVSQPLTVKQRGQ